MIDKAVPIVLRNRSGKIDILVFDHPLAGTQLVKGTIEPGEAHASAAVRELAEESGLTGVAKTIFLGEQTYAEIGQRWHLYECVFDHDLPADWEFFTEDDGGYLFKFYWRPIGDKIVNQSGSVFDKARAFVASCKGQVANAEP